MTLRTVYLRLYRLVAAVVAAGGLGASLALLFDGGSLSPALRYSAVVAGLAVCVVGPTMVALARLSSARLGITFFFLAAAGGAALAGVSPGPVGRLFGIIAAGAAFPALLAATLLHAESTLSEPRNRL